MGTSGFVAVVGAIAVGGLAAAQEGAQERWQPAPGPLMTKWAADVKPGAPLPEYPRPQMVRSDWLNLNGVWQFTPDASLDRTPDGWDLAGTILVPFPVESALSGIGKRHEKCAYRRTFRVPSGWRTGAAERVLLHFGAVDWRASVRVNNQHVGDHSGGYDPFTLDITPALNKGEGDQELVVLVEDPTDGGTQPRGKQVGRPEGIWYTPTTGIWQTVWIERVPCFWIQDLKIAPSLGAGTVDVAVSATGLYDGPQPMVRADVIRDGKVVAEATAAADEHAIVKIPDPQAWSPESPFLYDLRVTLLGGQTKLDSVESYFALRDIAIGRDDAGKTRILLNGKPYFGVGLLDQGFWPDGLYTAPTDEALRYDLEQAKALGFNLIRKHVKVEPQRWYYHADRLGMLVWQDMPSGDAYIGGGDPDITRTKESGAEYEAELTAMVENLRNHPCIVMWVPFNEGWGQFDTARITKMVKDLDPTRLVDSASGWTDRGTGDVHDIHVYPGPGAAPPEDGRASVLGEFGGLGLGVDGHTWAKKTWGYQGMADRDALTDRYVDLLRRCYALRDEPGLSAVIYTQLTDVETECNGLLTYDRAIVKMDPDRVKAANGGRFPEMKTMVATAEKEPVAWLYSFKDPGEDWERALIGGDDPAGRWHEGSAGFGTEGTPGAVVRTKWDGPQIWLRREFTLTGPVTGARLLIHHDEDAEVYLNGVLAATLPGYTTGYELVRIAPDAAATLRKGLNLIAVHCTQTAGGQYIDAGLVEVVGP